MVLVNALDARLTGHAILEILVDTPSRNPTPELVICFKDDRSADAMIRHLASVENYSLHEASTQLASAQDFQPTSLPNSRKGDGQTKLYKDSLHFHRRTQRLVRLEGRPDIFVFSLAVPATEDYDDWTHLLSKMNSIVHAASLRGVSISSFVFVRLTLRFLRRRTPASWYKTHGGPVSQIL